MFITDVAIKRPIFSIALSLIIIIVGLLSYMNLGLQQYPDVEEQVLIVETNYSGAAANIVESKITTFLEDTLAGIPGLDYMESSSNTGSSHINLFLRPEVSLSDAASDVRERISQVVSDLPEEADSPVVIKSSESKDPFMYLTLTSQTHPETDLTDYADRNLKGTFETIPGVGSADIYGNAVTMQVRLDREKMKAHNVSVTDVINALEDNSREFPGGSIVKGQRYVNIVVDSGLNTPEEMSELVVRGDKGSLIYLKDIASITFDKDSRENEWLPRYNKSPAVFMGIKKRADGNVLSISHTIKDFILQMAPSLPQGMKVDIGYDFSMFIDASIKAVQRAIVESIILVLLIVFFFLHSARATLIPLLTIPVSLIGSFVFLYLFGCSINTITLLAMVLAIGLVVDDAIVVLENIHRHIEEGLAPMDAALKGSREVAFAVIVMTLTLASVYAPIAFIQGLTGKLFAEFAVSLAGAVLISGVVALTLSPMMCSRLLKPKNLESRSRFSRFIEGVIEGLSKRYQASLQKGLARPKLLGSLLALTLIAGGILFYVMPSELAPQEDQSLIRAWVQGPKGATLELMTPYALQMEELLSSTPEQASLWAVAQRSGIWGGIRLKPWDQRSRSQTDIIQELRQKAKAIPGVDVSIFPMKGLLAGGQASIEMALKTTKSYEFLEAEADKLVKTLKQSPIFDSVSHGLYLGTPQLNVQIDRNKASLLGVKIKDLARALEVMLSGSSVTTFQKEGKNYDVVVQSVEGHKRSMEDIGNFYVNAFQDTPSLGNIPLSNLITLKEVAIPGDLKHMNKMRSTVLNAELNPGYSLQEGLNAVNAALQKQLSPSLHYEPVGNLRKFLQSKMDMYVMFAAALLFIYLVLAIQFDSLIDPLLIMVTVPLSMVGGLLALYLTDGTLNIFSQIGLVTLVGLITKHGILIVDFANKERLKGLSVTEAIQKATLLRFRPILMTTGAMALGAIPLALAMGAGAESRQQIGWVLVGGLLGGTFFTLYAVPFVYRLVKGRQ
jgi:multidrug efflux pump